MYNYIISILILLIVALSINITYAHPWKVDSNWGHTCYKDCELYWLEQWEYHYHLKSWNDDVYFTDYKTFLNSELRISEVVNNTRKIEMQIWKINKKERLILIWKINIVMKEFSWFNKSVEYNGYYMSLGHLYNGIQLKLAKNNYQKAANWYIAYWTNLSNEKKISFDGLANLLHGFFANIQLWDNKQAVYVRDEFMRNYELSVEKFWKTNELVNLWKGYEVYDKLLKSKGWISEASGKNIENTWTVNIIQKSTKWTKAELQSKIKETEDSIQSWKKTYDESFKTIEDWKWYISRYEWLNREYESLISWTRSKYNWLITQTKSNKEIEIQSITATYARLWLSLSTAINDNINNISQKYDTHIISLENEMNYNIAIYQDSINRNNAKISENQSYVIERTKKLEEFWQSIKTVEKNLEMYKSELAKL